MKSPAAPSPEHILEVLYSFRIGGSERLGATLAQQLARGRERVSACATHTGKGPISDELERAGIACFAFGFETRSRLGKYLFPLQFFWFLVRRRVTVVHAHHVFVFQRCYWPARFAGVRRIVLTEHSDHEFRAMPDYRATSRRYGPRADRVTVIHSALRDYMTQHLGVSPGRVTTIYNCVDTVRFAPGPREVDLRSDYGLEPDAVLVGWVGRMQPVKDLGTLIEAFARVVAHSRHKPYLVLVGDGEERAATAAKVSAAGLAERVLFLGARADIPQVLRNFDLCVSSSRLEGVPLALLEAMSTGVPCVATRVGGVPEVLDESVGRLVDAGDADGLAHALLELVNDGLLRRTLGRAARAHVLERFAFEDMVRRYREALVPA